MGQRLIVCKQARQGVGAAVDQTQLHRSLCTHARTALLQRNVEQCDCGCVQAYSSNPAAALPCGCRAMLAASSPSKESASATASSYMPTCRGLAALKVGAGSAGKGAGSKRHKQHPKAAAIEAGFQQLWHVHLQRGVVVIPAVPALYPLLPCTLRTSQNRATEARRRPRSRAKRSACTASYSGAPARSRAEARYSRSSPSCNTSRAPFGWGSGAQSGRVASSSHAPMALQSPNHPAQHTRLVGVLAEQRHRQVVHCGILAAQPLHGETHILQRFGAPCRPAATA